MRAPTTETLTRGATPESGSPALCRRKRTRARLLQAALELLRSDGVSGVSVSRVTRAIGVHHTLFYSHFKTVDDCLAAAARDVVSVLSEVDELETTGLLEWGIEDRAQLARLCERRLRGWVSHRPLVEVFLRHHLEPSAFGEALRPALSTMRARDERALSVAAHRAGIGDEHTRTLRELAGLCVYHFLWALERCVQQEPCDLQQVSELFADAATGTVSAAFARLSVEAADEARHVRMRVGG